VHYFGIFHVRNSTDSQTTSSANVLAEVVIVVVAEESGTGELRTEVNLLVLHFTFKWWSFGLCCGIYMQVHGTVEFSHFDACFVELFI